MWSNRWREFLKCFSLLLLALASASSQAIPVFARQVEQNCVSCHVGGQYPELTAYGRYFKLSGFTQGVTQITKDGVGIPVAMSIQAGMNTMQNNGNQIPGAAAPIGSPIDARNGDFAPDQVSIYTGGRIADNFGAFFQYTGAFDQGNGVAATVAADNMDFRYADHIASADHDVLWGVSLNNNPTLTDVFNSVPAWNYPYQASASGTGTGPPVQTALEAQFGGGTARGVNLYGYFDKKYYVELGFYDKNPDTGPTSILTGSSVGNGSVDLIGSNLYYRLAYTYDWGPNSLMVGALGMNAKIGDGTGSGLSTEYADTGFDAQYQYISDPDVISAQFRYLQEKISDPNNLAYANTSNTLNSLYAKAMYVYKAKYGVGLAYQSIDGSADATAYPGTAGDVSATFDDAGNVLSSNANMISAGNSPDTAVWIPSIFWQPLQNLRVTLYQTLFTKFMGTTDNYDGFGRKASDNNTTYLYLWMDF
jgi:hypothetical protein